MNLSQALTGFWVASPALSEEITVLVALPNGAVKSGALHTQRLS